MSRIRGQPGMAHVVPEADHNESLPCKAEDCHHTRYGLSNHCRYHYVRNRENGHPTRKIVFWKSYPTERRQCRDFLLARSNANHPALLAAGQALRDMLATSRPNPKIAQLLHQLTLSEVRPSEIVIAIAARLLYARRTDPESLSDERYIHTEIGRVLMNLRATRYRSLHRTTTGVAKRMIGKQTMECCGDVCREIARLLSNEAILRAIAKTTPFHSPFTGAPLPMAHELQHHNHQEATAAVSP